jgi:hypothetical protein
MIARNCTQNDLETALQLVNTFYSDNLRFRRLDRDGKGLRFTLTVNRTSIGKGKARTTAPGVRHGYRANKDGSPRRIAAACWHAHGHFFEALLSLAPSARVLSSFRRLGDDGSHGSWISAAGGNWIDGNIGSSMYPLRMSEACDCDDFEADKLTLTIRGEALPI